VVEHNSEKIGGGGSIPLRGIKLSTFTKNWT